MRARPSPGQSCSCMDLLFTTGAHSFARDLGIPDVSVQTFPMFAPTRDFPECCTGKYTAGPIQVISRIGLPHRSSGMAATAGTTQLRRRSSADLPEKLYWPFTPSPDRPLTPLLFAYSPVVLPRPSDWTAANIHVTGYFFLDSPDEYQPPPALQDFLDAGDPPVCISFGSMVNQEAERIHRAVCEALAQTASRGIFLSGWGGYHG